MKDNLQIILNGALGFILTFVISILLLGYRDFIFLVPIGVCVIGVIVNLLLKVFNKDTEKNFWWSIIALLFGTVAGSILFALIFAVC